MMLWAPTTINVVIWPWSRVEEERADITVRAGLIEKDRYGCRRGQNWMEVKAQLVVEGIELNIKQGRG